MYISSPLHVKRRGDEIYIYMYEKRPAKETYIYEKRPTKETYIYDNGALLYLISSSQI